MIGSDRRTKLIARGAPALVRRDPGIYRVVVATEDTYAAHQYLHALQEHGIVDRSRVEVVTLPTTDGHSTLGALVERLKDHQEMLEVQLDQDEYWAVFDVDQQEAKKLSAAVELATEARYRLAGSNPSFELWLLLHLTKDVAGIPSGSDNRRAARLCEDRLHDTLQDGNPQARGYDKRRIGAERFAVPERVSAACERARALSPAPEPWPSAVGTRVYTLIERLPRPPAPLAP